MIWWQVIIVSVYGLFWLITLFFFLTALFSMQSKEKQRTGYPKAVLGLILSAVCALFWPILLVWVIIDVLANSGECEQCLHQKD